MRTILLPAITLLAYSPSVTINLVSPDLIEKLLRSYSARAGESRVRISLPPARRWCLTQEPALKRINLSVFGIAV